MWPAFGTRKATASLKYLGFSEFGPAVVGPCDLNHIHRIEPALSFEHPNAIERNSEDTTMTSLLDFPV